MNEVKPFTNEIFGTIRAVEREGEIWFVGKDVCQVFGDTNHNRSLGRVGEDDKQVTEIVDKLGRKQSVIVINESGLYSLLFAMQPQKTNNDGVQDAYPIEVQQRIKKLKAFKHWVTSEVLPSIRKHGAYITQPKIEEILANPDIIIELATTLKKERAERQKAEEKLEAAKPKVLFADAVSASGTTILIGELAKLIKQNGCDIGQQRMFAWLRNNGYLVKRQGSEWNTPTQRSMEMGLFKIKETVVNKPDGSVLVTKTVKVTGKGQTYFVNKFLGEKHA